mgnify:CR=1 FL=1
MVGIPNFDPKPYLAPRKAPKALMMASLVLIGVGVVSAILGGFVLEDHAIQTQSTILVCLVYFTGISAGGVAFLGAMHIVDARWSRPLKRFAEALAVAGPVWVLLLLAFLGLGGLDLYEWHTDPSSVHGHKHIWLQGPFFMARLAVLMLLVFGLALVFIRRGLQMDASLAAHEGSPLTGWIGSLAPGGDHGAFVKDGIKKLDILAPIMSLFFAVGMTFFAFDVVMSLSPHWYSNMFGGWHFASCFWLAMVWIGILSIGYRKWMGVEKLVTPETYHDLGKLIFAFSMVWAYMFFAQLLPIWYGNMTEEVGFLLVRMAIEPWAPMAKVVGAMCFLIPFGTLLSRGLKKMPMGLIIVLSIIATGVWLERFLVTVPSIWLGEHIPDGLEMTIPLGPLEIGVALGFVGALLFITAKYLSSVPPVPVADPFMLPHPDDIHVHPVSDHGHAH